MKNFMQLVRRMRVAQNEYKATLTLSALEKKEDLEFQVDSSLRENMNQLTLF